MTHNRTAYSASFPSQWILEDGNDKPSRSPSMTPVPKAKTSLTVPLFPSPSPASTSTLESAPLRKSCPGTSKYLTHFPSSWALQPSSSPSSTPSPTPTLPNLKKSISLSTSPDQTFRPPSYMRFDRRSVTAFNLEPQNALWKQLSKEQVFSVPREDDDYLENFRETLNMRLAQSVKKNGLRGGGEETSNKQWYRDMPEPARWTSTQQRAQSLGEGNEDRINKEDDGVEAEEDYCGSGYGDVPHQAPAVADAYSTRGSSSVISH